MDFFRHKRNFSVHEAPLTPRQNITVRAMSLVRPDGVWDVRVIKHGKVVERREVPLSDQNEPIELPAHATYTHLFPDFPGGERDVVSACEEYLSKLNSMVSEWKQLGL